MPVKTLAVLAVLSLTGCADYPIALRVDSAKGGLSYSRDAGVSIIINADK